ncbi:Uncharacterised protein [Clostridioides difficile]|nr:Uncharacterised protein [Clostridioides difficile]
MPHHIYNQITEGLPACGEVFGDFYTVVPTYKILRAVLCLYDLPCPGCKNIAFAFCHPVSSIFSFQGTMPHRGGENFCLYYHLSFTVCRCCRFSSASISGGIRSTSRCKLSSSLFSFARSIVSFILPFSLAFALASNFSFSANRSLIVTLYFFNCPEKFSICGNHFFSMERASSFFFPAFSGLMPSRAASMALACLERETACLKSRVGICFRPVLLALSPRSKSGYFSTI